MGLLSIAEPETRFRQCFMFVYSPVTELHGAPSRRLSMYALQWAVNRPRGLSRSQVKRSVTGRDPDRR